MRRGVQAILRSWLEDQDFFRFSGIFRPVFLYAKPRTHIEDLWLRAGLAADNATGTLAPRLKTSCADPACAEACTVDCRVTAPRRRRFVRSAACPDPRRAGKRACMVWQAAPIALPGVRAWSHEDPALYAVTLTLRGAGRPRHRDRALPHRLPPL